MRIGSLFSGYGGLDMGVQAVLGGTVAWHSDIDKGSCKLLAHRFPDVPNLGDVSKIDWLHVTPVEIITAGFPCQPVSHAGKRLGDDDERWLWDEVVRAVRALRPGLVLLENVRGLLTARSGRLFGRVLGSLADSGYDAQWVGIRAADTGAPHNRFRVFILAEDAHGTTRGERWLAAPGQAASGWARPDAGGPDRTGALLPTPRATDGTKGGPNQRGSSGDLMLPSAVQHLLPTPAVNDMGASYTPDEWDAWTARMKAAHGNGNGHGASLAIEAQKLLPTPTSMDSHSSGGGYNGQTNADATVRQPDIWGDYAPAIARWESLTRPAPAPTMTSTKGNPQLAPAFVEWMMGLPAGWITDVPGLTRNDMLKLCGNGVVPQQAEAALRLLLAREVVAA